MSLIKANGAGDQSTGFYNNVGMRSLRLGPVAGSAYMSKTFSSDGTGSGATCTLSTWVKRNDVPNTGYNQWFFCSGASGSAYLLGFRAANDVLSFTHDTSGVAITTTAEFRDANAWYHIMLRIKTSESSNDDKYQLWVNGVRQAVTLSGTPVDTNLGANVIHNIGRYPTGSSYANVYLSDMNFVDGLALDATNFGEFNNGIWIAKEPVVSEYGTNGFRFKFNATGTSTSSGSVSPTNIGDDSSGKNNHFAVSGINSYDSNMPDTPENNWCTLSPQFLPSKTNNVLLSGNLIADATAGSWSHIPATWAWLSGKWYWEVAADNTAYYVGAASPTVANDSANALLGWDNPLREAWIYHSSGLVRYNGSNQASGKASISANDILAFAVDIPGQTLRFYVNNSLQYTASHDFTGWYPAAATINTVYLRHNFGQDGSFSGLFTGGDVGTQTDDNGQGAFKYAPPSGYLAMCSVNSPELTISPAQSTQAVDHFGTLTYTSDGNAVNIVSGANDNNGTAIGGEIDFSPDWVWIKRRNAGNNHQVFDTIRGQNVLVPNENGNQSDYSSYFQFLSSSNGFRLPATSANMNANGGTFVAWNWLAGGGSSVTNNDGSIASTVSANTTAGFSIVKATSPSSGTWTVGHGLGATPDFVIQKYLASSSRWTVFHNSLTSGQYLGLNESNAVASSGTPFNFTFNTTVIGGNSNYDATSTDVIYYVFREILGYSKVGTYTGNGSADGTFVYTGFRPAFLLYKSTGSGNWLIDDNVTQAFNPDSNYLVADTADAEGDTTTNTAGHRFDMYSSGFKMRNTNSARNGDGTTYVYLAFAEAPFKFANAR